MDPYLYPHFLRKKGVYNLEKVMHVSCLLSCIFIYIIVIRAKKPSRTGQNMMMLKKTSVKLTVNISN